MVEKSIILQEWFEKFLWPYVAVKRSLLASFMEELLSFPMVTQSMAKKYKHP